MRTAFQGAVAIHIKTIYILQKKNVKAIACINFTALSSPVFSDKKILKMHKLFHLMLLFIVYESACRIFPSVCHMFFKFC